LQSARFACHYIAGLTIDGYLLFWNASTSMLLRSLKLLEDGEKAIDFMLLDFTLEKEAKLSENCKVVLLSKAMDDTYRLQIILLGLGEVIYTKMVDSSTQLVDRATHEEGLIVFVQIIYKARIEHFVEMNKLNAGALDTSDADNFFVWVKNISDQDWESLERHESLEMNLWTEFLSGFSWENILQKFCKIGRFCEARLLWGRYRTVLEGWIKEPGRFVEFIEDIDHVLWERTIQCDMMGALKFLEEDVIPVALLNDPVVCCTSSTHFLMNLARLMETKQPQKFPGNSLQIASTMERVIQNLINSSKSPSYQAHVAYALSMIRCDSSDPDALMGDLNTYVKNLREMVKLKDVYQCAMSYNDYQEQTVESICYLILERVRNVQLIKRNLDEYARPYMEEYKLDPDRTLYNYTAKISSNYAGVVSSSNPWDERCLAVAEGISNIGLRCEALIGIAKRAHPPWTKQLSTAVYAMLNSPLIEFQMYEFIIFCLFFTASRLQRECDVAALGEMMMRYQIPFHTLELYLTHTHTFSKAIEFIFRQGSMETEPQRILADALKITELANKLHKGLMESHECIFHYCFYLIKTKGDEQWFVDVFQCLNDLSEADRDRVIAHLKSYVEAALSSPFLLKTELHRIANALMVEENQMFEVAVDCALSKRNPVAALEYAK
uniref:Rod_C domain-containing protein n=2 Tax=Gongylonema pulchrum TaxID=637853 RepID=A0A183DWA8_9BILA